MAKHRLSFIQEQLLANKKEAADLMNSNYSPSIVYAGLKRLNKSNNALKKELEEVKNGKK